MAKKEESLFKESINLVKDMWLDRKGNEAHAAVQRTINALFDDDLRPLIIKKQSKDNEKLFIISLPPGLCYADIKRYEGHFRDSTGGAVQIDKHGKAVHLTVMTSELQKRYPFKWDWYPYQEMYLPVHFGYSAAGELVRDITRAPYVFIAGHPGAGKSNMINNLLTCMLLARDNFIPIILDQKEVDFGWIADNGLGIVANDIPKIKHILQLLNKELDRRKKMLRQAGVRCIQDYPFKDKMPWVVLVADELAELNDEECQELLNRILRLGRAEAFVVIGATQRPSSTLFQKFSFGDSKAMFSASICFHVRDAINSRMVLDNDRASLIPGDMPGRGIFQWDKEVEFQAMEWTEKEALKLLKGKKGMYDGYYQNDQSSKRLPPRQSYSRNNREVRRIEHRTSLPFILPWGEK